MRTVPILSEVKMTDSEDDWFEKDIDEFVVKAQPSNIEIISVSVKNAGEPIVTPTAVFTEGKLHRTSSLRLQMSGKC